ncbi:O-antigen ligase domain-containing protein [Devosia sp. XJ19-1]|uniref:O-antigen ligase domain-containing protein n=1 Tax=Devosia ureilytica TaxID=2952754 RepID=A0A9Q4FQK0_9HYPH|nr:O-antigen ligase family protein [Devosia ureilytica]MCP8881908.1 O-antigen ligase domain-containing protein [Devosia ureilytica]MCP8886206.1 O-antigen ligase domain-containing protein [Devosia ureilytica]
MTKRRSTGTRASQEPAITDAADGLPGFIQAIRRYPASMLRFDRTILTLLVFGVGFFVQCNVLTSSLGLRFLRISDLIVLIGLPIIGLAYLRFVSVGILVMHVVPMALLFLATYLFGFARGEGEFYTTGFTYLYAMFFLFFAYLLFKEDKLEVFCRGILAGFIATSLFLLLDVLVPQRLATFGLSMPFDAEAALAAAARGEFVALLPRIAKPGGLWSAGNEAGPALALAAAAAAFLAERHKRFAVFAAFAALYLLTFTQTLNRSGLVAVAGVGALLYIRLISRNLLQRSIALLLTGILALALLVPYGLFEGLEFVLGPRFSADANFSDNLHDRWVSLVGGLDLALNYPAGIGFTERYFQLSSITGGISTPHNGFLSSAYSAGLGYALVALWSVAYVLTRSRKSSFFMYTALVVLLAYLFEELSFNPAFMASVSLLIAYAVIDLEFRVSRGKIFRRTAYSSVALDQGQPSR